MLFLLIYSILLSKSVIKFMSITINYKNNQIKKNSSNVVLFVDEKFNILSLKKHILVSEYSFISDLLRVRDLKKSIINFDINSKKKNNISCI